MELGLESHMFSRLGRACHEDILLVDRAQHLITERKPSAVPYETNPMEEYELKAQKNWIDLNEVLGDYNKSSKDSFGEPKFHGFNKKAKEKLKDPFKDVVKQPKRNLRTSSSGVPKYTATFKVTQRKPLNFESQYTKKPAVGQYYPHHAAVFPLSPQWGVNKSQKICFFDEYALHRANNSGNSVPVTSEAKERVKGFVKFAAQLKRSDLHHTKFSPHESRFEPIDYNPKVSSTYRKKPVVDLSKTSGHSKNVFPVTQTNIQYDPKTFVIDQRSDKGIMKFDKMSKRELNFASKLPYVLSTVDQGKVERGYKMLGAQRSVPSFDKSKVVPERHNPFGLPRFLVGLNNRMGVMIMSPTSLKSNNYTNSQFATTGTSFVSPKGEEVKKMKGKSKIMRRTETSKMKEEENSVVIIGMNEDI